eukprot:1775061-Prymnesium_polylepis.1
MGVSRRRSNASQTSVAGASQDGGVSKWTRGSSVERASQDRWGSRLKTPRPVLRRAGDVSRGVACGVRLEMRSGVSNHIGGGPIS